MPQPERGDQRADFNGGQHFIEARLFDVQDLSFERQHCLSSAVSALLGRTAR